MESPHIDHFQLTALLRELAVETGCEDALSVDAETGFAQLQIAFDAGDARCLLRVEVNHPAYCVQVLNFGEITVPEARYAEAMALASGINVRSRAGCLCVSAGNPFCFRQSVDMAGLQPTVGTLVRMIQVGIEAMGYWGDLLGRVALTRATAGELLAEHDAATQAGR